MSYCPKTQPQPQNKGRLSLVSQALLAYVSEHLSCSFSTLQTVFCPNAPVGKGSVTNGFRARLAYLVSVDHLKSTNVDGQCTYQIGSGIPRVKPTKAASVVDADLALKRAPPAQYNRMQGNYEAEASPFMRPGALDFKNVVSHGFPC